MEYASVYLNRYLDPSCSDAEAAWEFPIYAGGSDTNTFTFTDNGLANGQTYYYRLYAGGYYWYEDFHEVSDVVGPYVPNGPSSAPQNLRVSMEHDPVEAGTTYPYWYVHLQWDPPADTGGTKIFYYQVWRCREIDGENGESRLVKTFYLEMKDPAVDKGSGHMVEPGKYFYYVTAIGLNGLESEPSNEVWIIVYTPPTAPRNLCASMVEPLKVRLQWECPLSWGGRNPAFGTYEIWRWDSGQWNTLAGVTYDVLAYEITESPRESYTYRVCAVSHEGKSWSEVSLAPPSAPQNLRAVGGVASFSLSWDAPASINGYPIDKYQIWIAGENPDETGWYLVGEILNPSTETLTYLVSGTIPEFGAISPRQTCSFKVDATNYMGTSPSSSVARATSLTVPPSPPQNLQAATSWDYVALTWTKPAADGDSAIQRYCVYRYTQSLGRIDNIGVIDVPQDSDEASSQFSFWDRNLVPGWTYRYQVTARNLYSESGPSNIVTVTVPEQSATTMPLEVTVDSGPIYFPGENVDFHILVARQGVAVNPTNISATLCGLTEPQELSPVPMYDSVTGLFHVQLAIDWTASGTYSLVVAASCSDGIENLSGVCLKSFEISPTLTGWNAELVSIEDGLASISVNINEVQENVLYELDQLDALVTDVQNGIIATIETRVGEIQAHLSTIDATLVTINGRIALVNTALGQLQLDVRWINATLMHSLGKYTHVQTTVGSVDVPIDQIDTDYIPWAPGTKKGVDPGYYVAIATVVLTIVALVVLSRSPPKPDLATPSLRVVRHAHATRPRKRKLRIKCVCM